MHFSTLEKKAYVLGKLKYIKNIGYKVYIEDIEYGIFNLGTIDYFITSIDTIKVNAKNYDEKTIPFIEAWQNYMLHNHKEMLVYRS